MLSERIVASDSTMIRRGSFVNLTGVALEIDEQSKYRKQYFEILNGVYEEYKINPYIFILKSAELRNLIPSYHVHTALNKLTEELLRINSIKMINVSNTILLNDVALGETTEPGLKFLYTLQQYYTIVPVWRYYLIRRNPANIVILDGIQGKITKAWSFIGRNAKKVYVVPHGDQTYPCLSLCDLICSYIRANVSHIDAKEIYELLRNKTSAYVNSEFIGDSEIDYLSPKYQHSLTTEQHLPHPLFLIHKSKDIDNAVVKNTDFFHILLNYAQTLGGAVSFENLINQQIALQEGDCIICLDPEGYQKMRFAEILNPSRKIKVLSVEDAYKLIQTQIKQSKLTNEGD